MVTGQTVTKLASGLQLWLFSSVAYPGHRFTGLELDVIPELTLYHQAEDRKTGGFISFLYRQKVITFVEQFKNFLKCQLSQGFQNYFKIVIKVYDKMYITEKKN